MINSTLAEQIKEGNEHAFRELYNMYYPRVLAWLRKTLKTDLFTEDIAQDVFFKVWTNRAKIDPALPLEAWLFTIVRNTTLSFFKRQLKATAPQMPQSYNPIPERTDHTDALTTYETTLNGLLPQKQYCFRLHREQGLTYRQIAQQQGLTVRTVELYISEALKALRKKLLTIFF